MTTKTTDATLDEQREALLQTASPLVSEALARFNVARSYAPGPMVTNIVPTHASTTTNR